MEPTDWRGGLLFSFIGLIISFHLVLLVALIIVTAATDGPADEVEVLAVEARTYVLADEFSFAVDLQPAGSPIEMTLDNQGAIFHNLLIEGVNGFVLEADPAEVAVGVIDLPAGTWVMYCDVPGHREAGMEADLVVGG